MDNRPIIVGGCHRSGTSLVRRILNAHSRIHCGPEIKFLRDFFSDYLNDPLAHARFFSTARSVLPEDEVFRVAGKAFIEIHELAARRAGKTRWADKNPENAVYLQQWRQLLGDEWVFVHVIRNPLDTLASIKEARFPLVIPADLDSRISFYLRYLEAGLDFGRAHPNRYRPLIYEELVSAPDRCVGSLMQWLGEAFEPDQMDFNRVAHQAGLEDPKVAGTDRVHSESMGRWRQTLTLEEAREIASRCLGSWSRVDPADDYRWLVESPSR
jgi:hypothetical protein